MTAVFIAEILDGIMIFIVVLLCLGLYRPVIAIWWMPVQNRIRVIRLYGVLLLVVMAIKFILLSVPRQP
jgi:hypothetical protein